ncbi:MAG TPA: sugar ABC transporter substrate-binding protein [Mesorhizobium sp.]|jgi:sorbitol/mannitol transport system substrate-binding protein|nr:sugar ABC transporter substrate-binding protein [Mesorhizobium sp.]
MRPNLFALALCSASLFAMAAKAETLTIATVNNGDMIRMQGLTEDFTSQNPDIELNWVTLEENVLRQNVTQDIATGGGQYDIVTIGTYEVPIWGKQNWLEPLSDLPADYNVDDLLPSIRAGLSVDGTLYAVPFYGESSFVMYRNDLAEAKGVTIPAQPTWDDIKKAAAALHDPDNGVYGICLRGKAGWGENTAFLTTMANSYGARWFDENWQPQFNSPEWKAAITDYLDLMNSYGPPGASSNGFNENLTLFQQGKCGMWIDATVAGSFVTDPNNSTVADKVGFALAPDAGKGKRANWLWAWSLGIPASSDAKDSAKKFLAWATGSGYTALVAEKEGWANVPPGTRTSLYANQEYLSAAPFAQMTIDSINAADPTKPTVDPVPYTGVQFVAIPEFQGLGTSVGQEFSAALAGEKTAEEALAAAQEIATTTMTEAGYIK